LKITNQLTEAKFKEFFENHYEELVFLSHRYVKDSDTARDIVQKAFIQLWDKRDEIDPDRNVKSYLSTSVRNLSLNWLRDNKKFNQDLLAYEGIEIEDESVPGHELETEDLQKKIDSALALLPEKTREVFILKREEGLKNSEIAERLDISIKTVESHMSKALKIFREELTEYLVTILIIISIFSDFL
jgi:RNA polymerase sigma-70 factor (ECF subfamily)